MRRNAAPPGHTNPNLPSLYKLHLSWTRGRRHTPLSKPETLTPLQSLPMTQDISLVAFQTCLLTRRMRCALAWLPLYIDGGCVTNGCNLMLQNYVDPNIAASTLLVSDSPLDVEPDCRVDVEHWCWVEIFQFFPPQCRFDNWTLHISWYSVPIQYQCV